MYSASSSASSYKKMVDWPLIIIYFALVAFGWMNLYAANYNPEAASNLSIGSECFKQIVWIGVSLICAGAIMLSDSKLFVEVAWIVYAASILLLFLVLFVGKEVYGAKSWIMIGSVAFQPAEFTKIGTALLLARQMSRYEFSFNFKNYVSLFVLILVPVVFILLQNDTGSALVYFVLLLAMYREGLSPHILIIGACSIGAAILSLLAGADISMMLISVICLVLGSFFLYRCGAKRNAFHFLLVGITTSIVSWVLFRIILDRNIDPEIFMIAGWAAASIFLLVLWSFKRHRGLLWFVAYLWIALSSSFFTGYVFENVLGDHQRTRINVLFGLEDDPLGAGYNVNQSLIAIGSGSFLGKGFLDGTQTKLDFVPKQTTDFIFCTVGEEWGFLGCAGLIVLYLIFFLRIIFLAEKQHSAFSRIYGYCVACVFFFHFTINICMTIGLMPVIGIPLPFFSYGGSSFWGFSIMFWIFIKLDTDRNFLIR